MAAVKKGFAERLLRFEETEKVIKIAFNHHHQSPSSPMGHTEVLTSQVRLQVCLGLPLLFPLTPGSLSTHSFILFTRPGWDISRR